MIEFEVKLNKLILIYSSNNELDWIFDNFKTNGKVKIYHQIFTFKKSDLYQDNDISSGGYKVKFIIGILAGDYFKIEGRILNIEKDVFIYKGVKLKKEYFIAKRNISVFRKINSITKDDIYLGGNNPKAVTEKNFNLIIGIFPSNYEIYKYVDARLGAVLKEYFDFSEDHEDKYTKYINKKPSIKGENLVKRFSNIDLNKYSSILEKLKKMLEDSDQYNEAKWQEEILQIILLLYPKYIYIFKETPVKEEYSGKTKKLDFLLVDSSGYTDIIEIKKPFESSIVSCGKYRDNYVPLRELSGAVMQVEKYIYYLNKWGKSGEDYLSKKYKKELPNNFNLKITNPGGIIIMGRSNNLTLNQKNDFEIIKRKYKNVVDIITYDDLIERLEAIVNRFKVMSKN